MRPQDLLAQLERSGVILKVVGDRLHVEAPRGVITEDLRHLLVEHKPELIVALASEPEWPRESHEAVRRHQRPEARLYPFLGRTVATRLGRGRLVEVLPDRAEVRVRGRVIAFLPSEIRPPGIEASHDEPFETVH